MYISTIIFGIFNMRPFSVKGAQKESIQNLIEYILRINRLLK